MYNQLKESEVNKLKDYYAEYIKEFGDDFFQTILNGFDEFINFAVMNGQASRDDFVGNEETLNVLFTGFIAGYETAIYDCEIEESGSTVH